MNDDSFKILNRINSPTDLKKLEKDQLDDLCSEIRTKLIDTVSKNGGHLASNLGTVELTVALHRVFNSPEDKICWDVGHQAYTHKLLTGRYEKFDTLRTEKGISGFVRPDESEHDAFYVGHAGVSVSQACGLSAAFKQKGSKNYAIAVLGDGSFTNGMVYEALNHAGEIGNRLIVILNDNEMAISENVGSMGRRLANVRAKPEYYRFKAKTEKMLNKIPLVGKPLAKFLFKIKNVFRKMVYKSTFFDDVGFRYIGPVDGHNIDNLVEAMESAKLIGKPVSIHVNTVKGKGYEFAENSPEHFHGVSEFDINTGKSKSSQISYSRAFGKALCEFAQNDRRISAVTAAMALGTGLEEFFKTFPERSYDVGIAEEHAVTFCSGLAGANLIPVFAVYSTFLQRCYDQLIHDGALQRRKMIIAVDRAGFVGEDGETHQGIFDVPMLFSIPITTVYSPATHSEISKCLYNALYKDENLVAIRYPRGSEVEEYAHLPKGESWEVFGDENAEISLVTYGRTFFEAMKASEILKEKGINIKVIKLLQISPIPIDSVKSALSSKKVYFLEEGIATGGAGQVFSAYLLENGFCEYFKHIAVNDEFVQHATVEYLFKKYGFDCESIAELIEKESQNE